MKYVLDASVAIKWVIVEPDSNKATRLREDYRNAIHDLIAPESFAIECAYSFLIHSDRGSDLHRDLAAVP
jgi:predicted nucleic acid-binding protein